MGSPNKDSLPPNLLLVVRRLSRRMFLILCLLRLFLQRIIR